VLAGLGRPGAHAALGAALAARPLSPQGQGLDPLLRELKPYVARYYAAGREEGAVEPRYAVNSSI